MSNKVKIRATLKDGITTVKAIISHPMETGSRKNKETGEIIPAHFIQEVKVTLNEELVMNTHWGTGISKNPYLSFQIKGGAAGDSVVLTWTDNLGESGSGEAIVKAK